MTPSNARSVGRVSRRVRGALPMTLLGPNGDLTPITARLCWCSDDPWAVTVTFGTGRDATRWLVGLDLLVAGCAGPAGLGDVSLLPAPNLADRDQPAVEAAELVVSSPHGRACFRLRIAELAEVLERFLRARDLAECTTSAVDVDAELARLLAEEPAAGGEDR